MDHREHTPTVVAQIHRRVKAPGTLLEATLRRSTEEQWGWGMWERRKHIYKLSATRAQGWRAQVCRAHMRLVTIAQLKNTAQTSLRPEKAAAMGLAREKRQWGGGHGDRSPSAGTKGL